MQSNELKFTWETWDGRSSLKWDSITNVTGDANRGSLLCSAARRSAGWSLQAGTASHSLGILWGPRVWAHRGWCEVWCRGRICFTFSSLLCIMSIYCFFYSTTAAASLQIFIGQETVKVTVEYFGTMPPRDLLLSRAEIRIEGLL